MRTVHALGEAQVDQGLDHLTQEAVGSRDQVVGPVPAVLIDEGADVDPSPCGSGRRFKHCHLRDTSLPVERRSGWLFNKVVMFVTSAARRANLVGLAGIAAEANCSDEVDDDEFGQVMVRFVGDLLLVSVAPRKGGGAGHQSDPARHGDWRRCRGRRAGCLGRARHGRVPAGRGGAGG